MKICTNTMVKPCSFSCCILCYMCSLIDDTSPRIKCRRGEGRVRGGVLASCGHFVLKQRLDFRACWKKFLSVCFVFKNAYLCDLVF